MVIINVDTERIKFFDLKYDQMGRKSRFTTGFFLLILEECLQIWLFFRTETNEFELV